MQSSLGTPNEPSSASVKQGRSWSRWLVRIVVGLLLLVALLLLVGAGYQWFASAVDQRAYPPPGELIDVGGHRLHLICMGEGTPTVILDALGDGTSAQWGWVQPVVAETTRVCAYDRAGRGWSESGPAQRDGETIAKELHTLLANAHVEGPKVYVGHSFGGLIARIYFDLYPEEVAGMILVDSGLPSLRTNAMPAESLAQAASDIEFMKAAPWMARFGLFRMIGYEPTLPEPQRSYAKAFYGSTALWTSLLGEAQALPMTDAQVEATGSLGDRPLEVVAATKGWVDANASTDEARQIYNAMQQEQLLPLSTNSHYREIEGASHASLVMDEDDAARLSAVIIEVVETVRTE